MSRGARRGGGAAAVIGGEIGRRGFGAVEEGSEAVAAPFPGGGSGAGGWPRACVAAGGRPSGGVRRGVRVSKLRSGGGGEGVIRVAFVGYSWYLRAMRMLASEEFQKVKTQHEDEAKWILYDCLSGGMQMIHRYMIIIF